MLKVGKEDRDKIDEEEEEKEGGGKYLKRFFEKEEDSKVYQSNVEESKEGSITIERQERGNEIFLTNKTEGKRNEEKEIERKKETE